MRALHLLLADPHLPVAGVGEHRHFRGLGNLLAFVPQHPIGIHGGLDLYPVDVGHPDPFAADLVLQQGSPPPGIPGPSHHPPPRWSAPWPSAPILPRVGRPRGWASPPWGIPPLARDESDLIQIELPCRQATNSRSIPHPPSSTAWHLRRSAAFCSGL